MDICLGDYELDCLTNLRFADDVLLFAATKKHLQKMMCEFKHSTEKVGLKIHPGKKKILSNQCSSRRKEMEIDNLKAEILTKEESTGDNRDQESNQGCLGDVLQIHARVDRKILPSSALASLIRHGDHHKDELRLRNMDTHTLRRTRKNDSIDTAQNAPPHHTNKKEIQEEDTGQK